MKAFSCLREPLSGLSTPLLLCLLLSACGSFSERQPVALEESASATGGRPVFTQRTEADDRAVTYIWQEGSQFVRLERAEPGAEPHSHPVTLDLEHVAEALSRVRIGAPGGKQLFTKDAIESLASPLAEALAKASADQEVTFAIAYRLAGMGHLISRRVTTGRLFMSDSGLNLIVGLLQTPFEEEMRATGYRTPFTPGSRNLRIQEGWRLASAPLVTHPTAGRDDWIRIDFATGSVRTRASPADAGNGIDTDKRPGLEQRLETLKHLLEKGLISDDAYEWKSRRILDDL